jgi:hypothetical protein
MYLISHITGSTHDGCIDPTPRSKKLCHELTTFSPNRKLANQPRQPRARAVRLHLHEKHDAKSILEIDPHATQHVHTTWRRATTPLQAGCAGWLLEALRDLRRQD